MYVYQTDFFIIKEEAVGLVSMAKRIVLSINRMENRKLDPPSCPHVSPYKFISLGWNYKKINTRGKSFDHQSIGQ